MVPAVAAVRARAVRGNGATVALLAVAVAVTAAAALWPAAARADAAAARAHFDRGKSYFQLSEYRKALDEFKAAHVEKPDPAYLYNIAECHRNLGEPGEAVVFYKRFLKLAPPDSGMRSPAEKQVAELEAALAKAGPSAAPAPGAPPPAAPPASAPPPMVAAASPAPPPTSSTAPAPALLTAAPAEPGARPEPAPFYKRGWFYVAVGVAVIGGAAAVWALSSGGGAGVPSTMLGNQGIFK
jgi:tetratricopeptide (TPR) repeat protein